MSQTFLNSVIPAKPLFIRFGPSKLKGRVTIPTVKTPISLAICATLGAAPVPVPPPIPAVMKTISAPSINDFTASLSDSIASLPISDFAPAPSPLVRFLPICILFSAALFSRSCASVFITIKSTPFIPAWIILLTAFPPAPPTPITFRFAFCSAKLSNSNSIVFLLLYVVYYSFKIIL